MPVSDALRRLLRVRELEEEQQRLALDTAAQELHRLESALSAAGDRERNARRHVACEPLERIATLVDGSAARRASAALRPQLSIVEDEAARLRAGFLIRRTERRQVETLIAETESQDALIDSRRQQQQLDDAHAARKAHRGK